MSGCRAHRVVQDVTKNVNKNNVTHAVLFEAINLVIHLGNTTDLLPQACAHHPWSLPSVLTIPGPSHLCSPSLLPPIWRFAHQPWSLPQACGLLGRFISIREANIRYLGLETMARLSIAQVHNIT
jgi:hypothetical protein